MDVSPDIVSLVKWIRDRVYKEKMRWSKVRGFPPTFESLAVTSSRRLISSFSLARQQGALD